MAKTEHIDILLVEDSAADEMIIRYQLKREKLDYTLTRVETLEEMKTHLENEKTDLILSDFRLPRFSGLAALQYVRDHYDHLPFILISGALGDEMAAEMIKKGANDFLLKDRLVRLGPAVIKVLEESNLVREKQEKEEMLELISYIISHDLRSPVNNVSALAEMVDEKELKGEAKIIWPKIEKSVESLKETLDNLVKISLAGKADVDQLEKFRLEEVLEEVQADLRNHIVENHAELITEGLDIEINSNKTFVKSIFTNLLSNSLKYRHESRNPMIRIKASLNSGNNILLKYTDNGKGMDVKSKNVFLPFKRMTRNKSGYGLGLYITKQQVERLKGEISLESEENKGTTFNINLPQKDQEIGKEEIIR